MKNRIVKLYSILVCSILCAVCSYFLSRTNVLTTQELAKQAENKLHNKEVLAQFKLQYFKKALQTSHPKHFFLKYQHTISDDDIAIYVFKNDSLSFWTDNKPAVNLLEYINEDEVQLIKFRNGWYEFIKQPTKNNYHLIALIPIKYQYDYENKYLNNNFNSWLNLPENTKLITPVNYLTHAVKSNTGIPLFEIYRTDGLYIDNLINTYACCLFFLAFALFLFAVFLIIQQNVKHSGLVIVLFAIICLVIRTLMIYYKMPSVFYHHNMYASNLFADASSFYYSYLGDILLNNSLILCVSIFIYKYEFNLKNAFKKICIVVFGFFVLSFFSYQINSLIISLVKNSTISYNINELFNFSIYSFVGLISVGFLFYAFYLFTDKFSHILLVSIRIKWLCFIGILTCVILIGLLIFNFITCDHLWPILFLIVCFCFNYRKATHHFIKIGIIVVITTVVVSILFNKYEKRNKKETFLALASSLIDKQDVIAENEFIKISASIKKDIRLKNLLSLLPLSVNQVEQSLRQINFSGYFEKYEIIMSLFNNEGNPIFLQLNSLYLTEHYFTKQIQNYGIPTICNDLYFIEKKNKNISYIAKINIEDINKNPDKTFNLYLLLVPKLATNSGSFPDLLLDKSLENKFESKQISYAVYHSNKLLNMFGDCQYPLFIHNSNFFKNNKKDYEHHIYNLRHGTTIIISDKIIATWMSFTSNSYLLIMFSLLVLISVLFNSIVIKKNHRFISLNHRIQFILVSVVVVSLIVVVTGTISVVKAQFEVKNNNELITKSQSVLRDLQQSVGEQESLLFSYKESTTYLLKHIAQLLNTDITLFDKEGLLYATSQPAIFEQGLVSGFMNPFAYSVFKSSLPASYIQKENIGKLNYLSAYIPFYSQKGNLLGYINLPYFSRQKELEKELFAYLTTLINIYAVLFIATIFIALLVSSLLTKPLRIIKQQISNIQFGKPNESLQWKSKDEIGDLVAEYNAMLVKLEKSSELLARSERESAWREMAKQVAHEIKNPLTPMKLNIQHLQRFSATYSHDINEKINKVATVLIEQIDTLSHIATEFSNFAKFPNPYLEPVNLCEILQNITYLFQQNTECEISLSSQKKIFIMADKEQCLRIFTNLLKNAEQSIPEERSGRIDVFVYCDQAVVTVKIKDNGVGISEEAQSKLFMPNFTTKSNGTGLGLAMVKSAIVSFNGTILFETELHKGTIFTVTFPLLQ